MNAESVVELLAAVGVPAGVVSVGVEADNTWCLVADPDPETPGWEVFWREQGNRYDWARFTSEQVACHYLFGRLTWSQVVRGVVGVLPVAGETGGGGAAEPETGRVPPVVDEAAPKD
ncbi:hypothetical protein UO65_5297 [Actinokineospora spheciospongiae]|uniref:Uncharacterized protein n=1 Tax=Actinokineospora spheciospongiae TaxID=909613 RepID=W7ISQ1_9PSEU|nr:hypothetical protein [Actinokineospora spheciospongiae]EWC59436.1 hypothetical protein UO65_5297 [Actinokineospora spheciospongiae]PWW64535.1 hypothetical protein DFQ13_103509 [Actinokineospora spheciospongiae]